MNNLAAIEREARVTRGMIAELEGLTQRFDQALVRAETERNLHLAKIDGERAKLAELIDAAALIVRHLGADVPMVAEVGEVCEAEEAREVETVEPELEAVIAVADSPVEAEPEQSASAWLEDQFDAADEAGVDAFQSIGEIAAEVTAAVAAIADEAPATVDQSDAPEMTDHEVERLQDQRLEQTLAALEQDSRELETVGEAPRARPFMSFAKANPFA